MITPEEFKQDVLVWAKEVGVEPKEIHLCHLKEKWGHCSNKRELTFDISLLDQPENVRLRVILHELLHLRYPNHGRMFNILLNTYMKRASMKK
jgi:predicted metal-dependent hydrolase